MSKYIGIDVSKLTFDGSFSKKNQNIFENKPSGFRKLLKKTEANTDVIMEASGPYYLKLATFLYENGVDVYVVNPLKIKRFSQMNFNRAKTDKKDAEVIRNYGVKMEDDLEKWSPEPEAITNLKQLNTSLELLEKQISQTKNQLEAFEDSGDIHKDLKNSLVSIYKKLKKEQNKLEKEMINIVNKHYKETLSLLVSIPGLGVKTATMLIIITNNFDKFVHYKQLIAFIGLSPRIYQSGTSINGKGKICKMGNPKMRKLLYMCSLSASQYNKACVEMKERFEKKGKNHMVTKIAIANKVVKQAFAIVKSGVKYDKNFESKVCF